MAPPTIHPKPPHQGRAKSKAAAQKGQTSSELVCKVKYNNTLPDIPFEPKFIAYPFEANRFINYAPTSLERNYKVCKNDLKLIRLFIICHYYCSTSS